MSYTINKSQEVHSFPIRLSRQEILVIVEMLTRWSAEKELALAETGVFISGQEIRYFLVYPQSDFASCTIVPIGESKLNNY